MIPASLTDPGEAPPGGPVPAEASRPPEAIPTTRARLQDIVGDVRAPRAIFKHLTARRNRLLRLYQRPRICTADPTD